MGRTATQSRPKSKSSSSKNHVVKQRKESKYVRWSSRASGHAARMAAIANAQNEADLEALYARGLTEELAKELAEILGCEWDLVFRYAAKYGKMRDSENAKATARAFVEKHGKPGAPYMDAKPIFLTEKQEEAEKKSIAFQTLCAERKRKRNEDDKAKKQRAKDRAKVTKATAKAKAKPKKTIAKKKKTQAAKKPPPKSSSGGKKRPPKSSPPDAGDDFYDIYENLKSVCFDARVPNQPRFLLEAEVGRGVLIEALMNDGIRCRPPVDRIDGVYVYVKTADLSAELKDYLMHYAEKTYVRFTRYNIFQVGGA